jgi:nicotinate-nucleotide adenylyltransferase
LRCAAAAAEARGFDAVVLIPSAQPPHKPFAEILAPADDRLAMARLAADFVNNSLPSDDQSGLAHFEVDDLEMHRPGKSFTLDTVRELRRRGQSSVTWLIGADMLNYLPKWHRVDELLREADFLILARPGIELHWNSLPAEFQHLRGNVVPAPLVDISATEIRRRVRERQSIDDLVPTPVARYIVDHRLYA